MKLDRGTLCSDIMLEALRVQKGELRIEDFWHYLTELDLVFKPGDALQSILVKNRPKNKDVDYQEFYDKRK